MFESLFDPPLVCCQHQPYTPSVTFSVTSDEKIEGEYQVWKNLIKFLKAFSASIIFRFTL